MEDATGGAAAPGTTAGTHLLERDEELAEIDRLLADTTSAGAILFLSGDAGTGKTSLLEELRRRAQGTMTVRSGRCDALTTPAPFAPLYEMRLTLPPEVVGPLQAGRRELLFAALLEELSRTRSLFVVDDIHWADEATVDLLRYLGRRVTETRALIVCAFRKGEVGPRHPLRALLGELAATAIRRELRTLSLDAVSRLMAENDVDPVALYAVTGGNPFFVAQMLADPGASLPVSVEDAVLARARPLGDTAWELLELVGIAPEGIPLHLISDISPTAESDSDTACRRGLLTIEAGQLRAQHELIRRTFEAALTPTRRRRLHARLLDLLVGAGHSAVDTAVLAHHAVGAGDPDRTVRYSLAAAERASRDGAHREAAVHLANALRYRELMPAEVRQSALERHAYERYLIGEIEAAAAAVDEAIEAAATPVDVGRCLRLRSRLAWFFGERPEALRHGRRAVEVLEADGTDLHELAYAYSNLSQLGMLDSDSEEAATWGERAIELARAEGDVEVLAHALNNVGNGSQSPEMRRELVTESLVIALAHDLEEHAARAWTNLAYQAVRDGALDEGERLLADGLEYSEARDLETWWLYMSGTRAELHLVRGRWAMAARDAGRVLTLADGLLIRSQASGVNARLALRRGEPEAIDRVAQVLREARTIGEHVRLVDACTLALEYRWHTGEQAWDPALEPTILAQAVSRADEAGADGIRFWQRLLDPTIPDVTETARPDRFQELLVAAHDPDGEVRRAAFTGLADLGADGTLRALRRHLAARGLGDLPRGPNRSTRANPAGLTARQVDVLRLLARGASNAAIAEELVITPKTVEHHVSAILGKLGASTRGEAAARARDQGLA